MILDVFMFNNELDMLECRLTELEPYDVIHVLAEAEVTHRGVPKPLHYQQNLRRFARWNSRIWPVTVSAEALEGFTGPWAREHAQRDMAWVSLDPEPDDLVLICDVDEIPSCPVLEWPGAEAAAVRMRVCLYAVDWEVPQHAVPPQCVVAQASWLAGKSLAAVRDGRAGYPVIEDGGWHLSWIGGPEAQREKLEAGTCHTEILATPEAELIRSGARWRAGRDGGGLPVVPVDVDGTWPRYVRERRCPPDWFRPRSDDGS